MKHFFNFVLIASLLTINALTGMAQTQNLAGFSFANAIGIPGKADVTATGKKLTKNGIEAGMATSGLGLPPGNYQLQVTAEGCEPGAAPLTIAVGSSPIVVAYVERRVDPRTRSIKNFIRLAQFPSEPQENKYLIKVISVDPEGNFTANAGAQAQVLQNFRPAVFEAKTVKIADAAGGTAEANISQKGSYYCFAFRKSDGKPAITTVLQRIYQW